MNRSRPTGNIELHINELVLHGFSPGDRRRIGEAVRQELLRQFSERGIPDALTRQGDISRLNAGSLQMGHGAKPEKIGMQVAQAVYGSVSRGQQLSQGARHSGVTHNTPAKSGGPIES